MENSVRFDDLVRTERYFTATLLPLLLFHNNLEGVRWFVAELVEKATREHNKDGKQGPKGTPKYDFKDVEVITEFHIARDLNFAHLPLFKVSGAESEEVEAKITAHNVLAAPDVVIVAGEELVVCEGKFFLFFSDSDVDDLNEQLGLQRRQVRHLFVSRPIRAYRHVAILPFKPKTAVDADIVITWDEIGNLAEKVMGSNHYVTDRLRKAVKRHHQRPDDRTIPNFDGKLSFDAMVKKCRAVGDQIEVGHWEGEAGLLSLIEPEKKKKWKWRDPKTNKGVIAPENWLSGKRWLDIVESKGGFGSHGA